MAVTGVRCAPHFEDVRFDRIVIVPKDCPITIRLAALVRDNHRVDVVLRSSSTDFQVDHFRATCRFDDKSVTPMEGGGLDRLNGSVIALDIEHDLYGSILFHGARFRRVRGYRWLHAKNCVA
jgi:enediyne polyketide synthase